MIRSTCYLRNVSIAPFVLVRFYDHDPICMRAYEKCPVRHKIRAVHVELCQGPPIMHFKQQIPRAIHISNHPASVIVRGSSCIQIAVPDCDGNFFSRMRQKKLASIYRPDIAAQYWVHFSCWREPHISGFLFPPKSRLRTWRGVHIASEVGIQWWVKAILIAVHSRRGDALTVSKQIIRCILTGIQNPSKWGAYHEILMGAFWDMATLTCFFWQPWKLYFIFQGF